MKYKIYQGGVLIHTYNRKNLIKWLNEYDKDYTDYAMNYIDNEYGWVWTDDKCLYQVEVSN